MSSDARPSPAGTTIDGYRAYRIKPFGEILDEMVSWSGSFEALRGKRALELGPGTRVHMMRFLQEVAGVASAVGVGRAKVWPWTRRRTFLAENVVPSFMLDYLRQAAPASFDIIYSRHVMEQHSIDPWVLIFSRKYWRQFRGNRFQALGEDYPSSKANIQAVFREAWRALKPGGLIVSLIGKRKYSGLAPEFLQSLTPARVSVRALGRLSCVVAAVK